MSKGDGTTQESQTSREAWLASLVFFNTLTYNRGKMNSRFLNRLRKTKNKLTACG
ncbi:MAG: hypothetical protein NT166_08575 [Candidatus Aminicenantes bacterium]|nr:hypothetical protein [Candidatus Aminicenantes bacterium]